jgi:FkbM family methyltransferase
MGRLHFSLLRPNGVRDDSGFLLNMLEPYDIHTRICRGDVVLDAGASVGEQTLMYSAMVGREGRVISVEPSPIRAAMLKRNVELNRLGNVTVVVGALWSSPGTIELEFYSPEIPGFKMTESGPLKATVKTHTIDQIASELGIDQIDFLKMDIEGGEYEVLKNTSIRIKAMGMETHIVNGENTVHPIMKLLRERGYSSYVQWRSGGLHILNALLT